jgi:hypothetical protein
MKKKRNAWRLIAKALGSKEGKNDKEADRVAFIRLLMFLSIFVTNSFIVANALRHWNDNQPIKIYIDNGVPSQVSQTQEKGIFKTNCNFAYD